MSINQKEHFYIKRLSMLAFAACLTSLPAANAADVRSFGARGDGSTDDTAAVEQAINSTPAQGIVYFPAGTYRVSRSVRFLSNRTYKGVSGAVLKASGAHFIAVTEFNATRNLTVDGLTFDGGGIKVDGSSVPGQNVRIINNTFRNITHSSPEWTVHSAIFLPSGLDNSHIGNNTFRNILYGGKTEILDRPTTAIRGWRIARTQITDNYFDTVNQAISMQFDASGPFTGILIARNTGVRVHRMGVEMQGWGTQGMIVERNHFSNFLNPWCNSFGLSIVVDGGQDTIVRNNTVIASPPATVPSPWPGCGMRYGYGLEIGGIRSRAENNTIQGLWDSGVAIGTAPNVTVQNNYLCGSNGAMKIFFEAGVQPGAITTPNTRELACNTAPPPAPAPTPTPAPAPTPTPAPAPAPAPSPSDDTLVTRAGLTMWLRADKGVQLNSTYVSSWVDQSGNGKDAVQTSPGLQPTFVPQAVSGKPALRFDGVGDHLNFNLPINGLNQMTIVMVGSNSANRTGGASRSESAAIFWGETAWWGVTYLSPYQSAVSYRFGTKQTQNYPLFTRPQNIGNQYTITVTSKNATSDSLWVNGILVKTETGKLTRIAGATDQGFIGRGDRNTYFPGAIAEVLVYNRALTDSERKALEQYLKSKYSL